jgi:hypothetical protein
VYVLRFPGGTARSITRRELLTTAAAGAGTLALGQIVRAQDGKRRVRVAAVQMHATLGEVDANLENAERWARLALREGAQSFRQTWLWRIFE